MTMMERLLAKKKKAEMNLGARKVRLRFRPPYRGAHSSAAHSAPPA
jgi:hypothetical protein